ncbi:hypothetical protein [Oleidesulfovibrio sp.]
MASTAVPHVLVLTRPENAGLVCVLPFQNTYSPVDCGQQQSGAISCHG